MYTYICIYVYICWKSYLWDYLWEEELVGRRKIIHGVYVSKRSVTIGG